MKNILFDIYGTLVDISTDEEKEEFWVKLCEIYKYENPKLLRENYLSICKELSKDKEEIEILDVFKKLLPNYDSYEVAQNFRRLSTNYIKLYKGVIKLLKTLKKEGFGIYILSNAQSAFTIPELKMLKIYNYFDGIAISSDYAIKKPNKDFYLKAMNNFNLDISNSMMVGNDYKCDIAPSKELGLKTIFIKSNLTPDYLSDKSDLEGFNYNKLITIFTKSC